MITGFYAALLGFWLVFLMREVILRRFRLKVGLGDGGQDELQRAVRTHGNFTEHVPFALLVMLMMEMQNVHEYALHGYGVLVLLSRVLHWMGLKKSAGSSKERFLGTATLMLAVIGGGIMLVYKFIAA